MTTESELHSGRLFVIRPFGEKKDSSGRQINFDQVQEQLISPAARQAKLAGSTTIEIVESGNIRKDMFALIAEADVVVCDITVHNANVFYELGIRHALRKRRTLMIKGKQTADSTPFDLMTDRYLAYDLDNPASAVSDLAGMIMASQNSTEDTDSPVFQYLPELPEVKLEDLIELPLPLRESIELATTAKDTGRLKQLLSECSGQRYQWPGFKRIGQALFGLKEYEEAEYLWQEIRNTNGHDIEANEALANIYQRLSGDGKDDVQLKKSDQAIERMLAADNLPRQKHTEALTLKGRNQKTRWKYRFEQGEGETERRHLAISNSLIKAYEAYRDAFYEDLSEHYPGINAVMLACVLENLSSEEGWVDIFDTDEEAERYALKVKQEKETLSIITERSIDSALDKNRQAKIRDVWAELSKADLLFISEKRNSKRIVKAYEDALTDGSDFALDSANKQMKMLLRLGIYRDNAIQVLEIISGEKVAPDDRSETGV